MRWIIISGLVISWALPVVASPYIPIDPIPDKAHGRKDGYSKAQIRYADVEVISSLEEKRQTSELGSFSLAHRLPPNLLMFQISVKTTPGEGGNIGGSVKATCVECFTTGKAIVTTTGIEMDDSILGDLLHFLTNPTEIVVHALDLNLKLDLQNVTGYFEIDITFAATGSYTFPIFTSESPVRAELNDKDSVGLIFDIDLVFTVTGPVDFITGFEVDFPDDSYIILNPLGGELVEENLKGIKVNPIPAKSKSGAACVTVALRYKLKAGVSLEVLKHSFRFEAGAYIDAPQYKACITYQPDKPCNLNFTEGFYIDVGVYAEVVEPINFVTWEAGPTAVATLSNAPLPSTCFTISTSSTQQSLLPSSKSQRITQKPARNSTTSCSPTKTTSSDTAAFGTKSGNSTITGARPTGIGSQSSPRSSTRLTVIPSD
ncbi:hypothetical protein OCU04_009723 [Sclerotinia nivalis]|uniref:Uncharacterized protein n=1 Tax=Sclerotinia nivalis TaxID=352851 RepID=A0A9X0DIE9_9HELO|nr:hypothetical protein OCU04_009723 [Sclerotinia nivalis]